MCVNYMKPLYCVHIYVNIYFEQTILMVRLSKSYMCQITKRGFIRLVILK